MQRHRDGRRRRHPAGLAGDEAGERPARSARRHRLHDPGRGRGQGIRTGRPQAADAAAYTRQRGRRETILQRTAADRRAAPGHDRIRRRRPEHLDGHLPRRDVRLEGDDRPEARDQRSRRGAEDPGAAHTQLADRPGDQRAGGGPGAHDRRAPGQTPDPLQQRRSRIGPPVSLRRRGGIGHDHDPGADDRIDRRRRHPRLEPFNRPGLPNVQRLAGRDPPRRIDQAH